MGKERTNGDKQKSMGFIPAVLCNSCVTLGRPLHLSGPPSPHSWCEKVACLNPETSAVGDTRPLPAEAGKPENVAPGQRSGHHHFQAAIGTPGGRTVGGNVRIAVKVLDYQ